MSCRLCGDTHLSVLSNRLRHGPGEVFYCRHCDLGMLNHSFDQTSLASYYDGEYRQKFSSVIGQSTNPAKSFEDYKDFQGGRIELLKPFLTKKTRLLEIGCSAGMFLHHAAPKVAEAFGIDFDSASANYAQKVSGARTFSVPLPETGLPEKHFDLICLFQTVEHLPDPVGTLKEIGRWLKDDGRICVEVPNLADPLRKLYQVDAYEAFYYHQAHLFYFSIKSLEALMNQAGFSGKITAAQDYNFLNHLHWYHRQAPQEGNRQGLGPARLPLAADLPAAKRDLDRWAEDADREYKAILAKHGLTSNITFIGRKTGARR